MIKKKIENEMKLITIEELVDSFSWTKSHQYLSSLSPTFNWNNNIFIYNNYLLLFVSLNEQTRKKKLFFEFFFFKKTTVFFVSINKTKLR